jgi:hypothetical protein
MIEIPYDCPRGRKDCISLAKIEADDGSSFFCCGENNGKMPEVPQDIYTTCFKGAFRDEISNSDKRDLTHQASVLIQSLGVIEAISPNDKDWSPWSDIEDEH